MEPSVLLFGVIGGINLILAIGFIYYAFKNAIRLSAITQFLILASALFFVISGLLSTIEPFISDTIFIEVYILFLTGFLLILIGEIYSGRNALRYVGKKEWVRITRTFPYRRYRFLALFTTLFFTVPVLTLSIMARVGSITGSKSIFNVVTLLLTSLSFTLLLVGERKLYFLANVSLDSGTIESVVSDLKGINLLRDDMAAARIYSDIINKYLCSAKPVLGAKVVDDTINRWSEEHPVLFENCLSVKGDGIDAKVVIKNVDRVYEQERLPILLKEFSALTSRFVDLYGGIMSAGHARKILSESYRDVKKRYGDTPILFDILRSLPEGILEEEKLALLSKEELGSKVKKRTEELEVALGELELRSIELKQEKAYTENIVTSMADSLIVVDTGGNIVNVNRATLDLLNYEEDELIGQQIGRILSLSSSEVDESIGLTWLEKLMKNSLVDGEIYYETRGGTKISVSFSGSMLRDDEGEVQGFVCVAKDITERVKMERALKDSEGRYRTIFENTGTASVIIEGDMKISLVNWRFEKLSGYSKEEVEGKKRWTEFVSKKDIEKMIGYHHTRRVISGSAPKSYEFQFIDKGGNVKDIFLTIAMIPGTKKSVGSLLDITEHNRAENLVCTQRDLALSLSSVSGLDEGMRLCLEAAIESSGMDCGGVYLVDEDSKALNIVYHKGFSPNFMESVSHFDSDSDNANLVMAGKPIYTQHNKLGVPLDEAERCEGLGAIAVVPIRHVDRVIGSLNIASHTLDEVPLVARDTLEMIVTQIDGAFFRLKVEDALRESEKRYSAIVEGGNAGISIVRDLKIVFANQKVVDMIGYTTDELYEVDFTKVIDPKHLVRAMSRYHQCMVGKDVSSVIEMEMLHKDGYVIPMELTSTRIQYEGEPAVVIFTRDITERKQAEEEIKQKNEELRVIGEELREVNLNLEQKVEERTSEVEKLLKHKDEFIGQLGHDLKTPLTPLTSLLPIVEEKETDPKSKELVKICIHNVEYIKNLVISTLKLARLNSTDTVFEIREVLLREVIDSVIWDNQTIFGDNNVKIENEIGNEIIVEADPLQLKEVFNNLTTNAIRFMVGGGTLTLLAEENGDGFITASVKDTGIGISDEEKSHIFEEFYKADPSRHELASSGLGLAICKRIVEQHGGNIWVESEGKGKGTTFYFTIPTRGKFIRLDTPAL